MEFTNTINVFYLDVILKNIYFFLTLLFFYDLFSKSTLTSKTEEASFSAPDLWRFSPAQAGLTLCALR